MEDKNNTYHFLKEIRKEKQLDKKSMLIRAGILLASAVVFGAVAAVSFYGVHSLMNQKENQSEKIVLQEESPNGADVTDEQVMAPEQPEDTEKAEPEMIYIEPEPMELKDLQAIYGNAMTMAEEAEKSIVTVQGITNDVDWMNNSYENAKQISGFLAAENEKDYYVVTEYRVVDQVDRILVTFVNGDSVDAHFQKQDVGTGISVLKIEKSSVKKETQEAIAVAQLGSSVRLKRGNMVIALGSPASYSGAIEYGRITSLSNQKITLDNEYHLLTTDLPGEKDGSGVLINTDGKIVGMIIQAFAINGKTSGVTALPISEIKNLIERLSNNEDLAYLGIYGQDIVSGLSEKTGIPKGIYVSEVVADSPAMEAGIQNGDVIVMVENENVDTLEELRTELDKATVDSIISVTAMRKGAEGYVEIIFDVTVGAL